MPLRRLIFLSSLVLAVAALSPAAALGAANGTDRPLSGTVIATTHDNLSTGIDTADGTFLFTHLGKGTFHEDATLASVTGNTFTLTGTETLVAANGDKLFATVTATGTFTGSSEVTTVSTITGGTGRFADASGTFTTHERVVFVSIVGVILSNTFTGTAEGQISY
jgi:hypothetical protein